MLLCMNVLIDDAGSCVTRSGQTAALLRAFASPAFGQQAPALPGNSEKQQPARAAEDATDPEEWGAATATISWAEFTGKQPDS